MNQIPGGGGGGLDSLDSHPDEESDSCGDLPALGDPTAVDRSSQPISMALGSDAIVVQRRSSEFYPTGRAGGSAAAAQFGRQVRRDRRLSDPGRIAVPMLRLSLHHGAENGGTQPGVRLSDPRLAAIRSLFASGPCEVGEALAAPILQSSGGMRSPRSRSPTSPSADASSHQLQQQQQRHARWDTRRLSLPNPQPSFGAASTISGGSGRPSLPWLLPTEVNEAMGAVSGSPSVVASSFPLGGSGSPPSLRSLPACATAAACGPLSGSTLCGTTASATVALRRRRSVSLDQSGGNGSGRLEAITEENSATGGSSRITFVQTRKCSTPLASISYD